MTNNCNDIGVEKHINIDTVVREMSLFDGIKEEKAVSLQEREEDGCRLEQQLSLHQPSKSLCDENDCKSQEDNKPQEMDEQTTPPIHDEQQEEKQELLELRKRLEYLRKRRRQIQQFTRIECVNQRELLLKRLNSRRRDRSQIVDEYVSVWKGRDSVAFFLDCAKRWNVLNDCFSIWIDGKSAFATINGCRLGAEAASLPNALLTSARGQPKTMSSGKWGISITNNATAKGNARQNANNSPPRRRLLGLFGSNDSTSNANNPSEKGSTIPTILEPIRVPWMEVNAALGHALLLLKILQESFSKKGGNGMKFTHELHPMGATSKMGIRFGTPGSGTGVLAAAAGIGSILSNSNSNSNNNNNENDAANAFASPPVVYNLFFEESSGFSFFKNNARNFNWALQAFLQCIAEAAAQQADKTIAIPHAIQHKKATTHASTIANNNSNGNNIDNKASFLNGGEWTIGGLSICYPSQQTTMSGDGGIGLAAGRNSTSPAMSSAAVEWTRACRFLLTDLKWLVAYAAKHVDR